MAPKTNNRVETLAAAWPLALMVAYLGIVYAFQPLFFSPANLLNILYYTCLLVPIVLGVQCLITLGLFDLSVGAIAALCGVIVGRLLISGYGASASISAALIVGIAFGFLNWLLVSKARIPALIGTLVTMGVARALGLAASEGQIIGGLPEWFSVLAHWTLGSISGVVVFAVVCVAIAETLAARHLMFRRFYHVGSSRTAAERNGINVYSVEATGFCLAGIGAACVGVMQASRTLSASPFLFPDLALESIAACVIGGAGLTGGTGRPIGAVLGMFVVVISRNLVALSGISVYWKEMAIALVLLAAALFAREKKA